MAARLGGGLGMSSLRADNLEGAPLSVINRRDLFALSGLAAVSAAMGGSPAVAAAPQGGPKVPPVFRYKVGFFDVIPVLDGKRDGPLEPSFITNAPFDQVQAAFSEASRPANTFENPFTPTLINTGERLILIDTGNAPQPEGSPVGQLARNMAAVGLAPEQVDLVIISHFHGDHISGLKHADGKPVYPNAEVAVPARELAFWTDEGEESRASPARKGGFPLARRIFAPGGLRIRTYKEGDEISPGIVAVAAFGHSPGHMAFRVQSGGAGLLLLSDAAHVPFLFLRNPDWSAGFDMDAAMARETRRKLLDEAVADRLPVAGYHWGFPNVGHVRRSGNGFDLIRLPWPT
jgi:glyoxylase-like metal-dependent hydrolase (beta-lactamase superfamily II)